MSVVEPVKWKSDAVAAECLEKTHGGIRTNTGRTFIKIPAYVVKYVDKDVLREAKKVHHC